MCKSPIWSNLFHLGACTWWVPKLWMFSEKSKNFDKKKKWPKSEQVKSEQAKSEQTKSEQPKSKQPKSEKPKFPQITVSSMELFSCQSVEMKTTKTNCADCDSWMNVSQEEKVHNKTWKETKFPLHICGLEPSTSLQLLVMGRLSSLQESVHHGKTIVGYKDFQVGLSTGHSGIRLSNECDGIWPRKTRGVFELRNVSISCGSLIWYSCWRPRAASINWSQGCLAAVSTLALKLRHECTGKCSR